MEKYLAIIFLSAPGFIARFISRCLGASQSRQGEMDSIMVYFTYSLFSIVTTLVLATFTGIFSPNKSWSDMVDNFSSPIFVAKFFVISLVSSIVIAVIWTLWGKQIFLGIFNYVNQKRRGSNIFLEGTLFDKLFVDGKDHFLELQKDDKTLAVGFLCGWSSARAERQELFIAAYPEYRQWLEYAKEKCPEHPLNSIKGIYIDVKDGLIITERDFPPEWLEAPAAKVPQTIICPEALAAEPDVVLPHPSA